MANVAWNEYIERIREGTDFPSLIERLVELPRRPSGGQAVMAKSNPFRDEKTPSLAVYHDHAFDFGSGQPYDAFDVAQKLWNCSFIEAAERLAHKIGIERPTRKLTPEERAQAERQRRSYELLGLARDYYALRMEGEDGRQVRDYAHDRGFDDQVIGKEKLGASGGLGAHFLAAGVDIEDAIQAGLLVRSDDGHIYDAIPAGYLVFPYHLGGKVRFLSGRIADPEAPGDKKVRNIRNNGHTPKIPYLNSVYTAQAEKVVVVEGATDAVTLAQWRIPALALAGSTMDDRLVERLQDHALVYLCLDNDETGHAAAARAADRIGPMTQVIALPNHDVNEFCQDGHDDAEFRQAMGDARTWIDVRIEQIEALHGLERDWAMPELFGMLVKLDPWAQARYRTALHKQLKLSYADIKRYMQLVQETDAEDEVIAGARYVVKDGHVCRWTPNGLEALGNFSAEVAEEIIEDDGQDTRRKLVISGTHTGGKPFPTAVVDAKDFSSMGWVIDQWGIGANIYAGVRTREHLRSAIQTLSSDGVKQRWVYTHTGWRKIDGELVYLTHDSALGAGNVEITLTRPELQMYQLPVDPGNVAEAVRLSLSFLDVAPRRVTWPLWAAMYLAPLASIRDPDFIVWLYGTTGSLKSSITALALNHYGPDFDYNRLPASWEDTITTLEKKAFTIKDAPLVIDDFAPQSTTAGANELERRASRALRNMANRTSRGRMKSDLTDRQSHDPRGLIICTGEQLPSGHSIVGRLLGIEMQRDIVDLNASLYQQRGELCRAMTAYLLWLEPQMDELSERIHGWHKELFSKANQEASSHLRVPSAVASLYIGVWMGLSHAKDRGVLDEGQFNHMTVEAWLSLMQLGREQSKLVEDEDPSDRFLRVLGALLTQGVVYLDDKEDLPSIPKPGAKLLGWQDIDYLYLIPEATYNLVASFCRQEGDRFPLKERALYKKLIEDDVLIPSANASTRTLRVQGAVQRVLKLVKAKALPTEPESE